MWAQSAAVDSETLDVLVQTAKGFSRENLAVASDHSSHAPLLERGRINITVNTARQIAKVLEINLSESFLGLG